VRTRRSVNMDLPIERLPLIMSDEEVATLLRCKPETVKRYVHTGQLIAVQIGKQRRFRAEDVLEFVAGRRPTCRK
jgi:excisionase family DNA binding protein